MSIRLLETIRNRNKSCGYSVTSVCSAHPYVIRATLELHRDLDRLALIEATSNQVNQFGGYTGMRPIHFLEKVRKIALDVGFPTSKLVLGGDHLGPHPWRSASTDDAMSKACALVHEYVRAGFTKIHLDASMLFPGDPTNPDGELETEVGAERAALLCRAAESAKSIDGDAPVYVIGTDVPAPGGVSGHEKAPTITSASALNHTIECTQRAFRRYKLDDAWNRVVAIVVQPGVEFTDQQVFSYNRKDTVELRHALTQHSTLVFEGHSTDYQLPEHLQEMAEDSCAILKVGPALTFAFRETLFLLGCVEATLADAGVNVATTQLSRKLEHAMRTNPRYWRDFYDESSPNLAMDLLYSLSDRSRYYWSTREVDHEVKKLIINMENNWPPLHLLRQFFPGQYWKVRRGLLKNSPQGYIVDRIQDVLRTYPGLS